MSRTRSTKSPQSVKGQDTPTPDCAGDHQRIRACWQVPKQHFVELDGEHKATCAPARAAKTPSQGEGWMTRVNCGVSSQRNAHGHFILARDAPRNQQIRNIRAGDQRTKS